MNSKIKFALAISVAATLAACGGGGGGSSTASTPTSAVVTPPVVSPPVVTPPVVTPPVVVPPTVTPADLQTSVPALTYPANSPEFAFVTAYNNFRSQVGLGLLAQNASLDKAAASHVKYVTTNALSNGGTVDMAAINTAYNLPNFHVEDGAKVGFTGILPADRATFAGYKSIYVAENGTYGNGSGGASAFANLLATVYHRQGLMYQAPRDIGIAVGADQFQTTSEMIGYLVSGQSNASDYVGIYPTDAQALVPLFAGFESPNPFKDIKDNTSGNVAANTSYPITVSAKEYATLAVTTFTVTEAGQATPLKVRLITNATDSVIGTWNAMIVGYVPFKANTKYNVSFVGTVNGASVSKAWSFTTASSCSDFATCK